MAISYQDVSEDLRRIFLSGRLDTQGAEEIAQQFLALSTSGNRRVVVDFTEVSFLASTGIRLLVANANALRKLGGLMVLVVGENSTVPRTLAAVGLDTLLPMFRDFTEADAVLRQ
jgi:anti-anti-sigma factor